MASRRKRSDRTTITAATSPSTVKTQDTASRPASRRAARASSKGAMLFGRGNYVLLLSAIGLIILGYVILAVDNQIRSIPSLYIAPAILTAGYLLVIGAILHRDGDGRPTGGSQAGA